jgi:3-oxoacyl-(acyl-carrier-protein) synthase
MALFAQYAYAAAQEAVKDAGVQEMSDAEREPVVSLQNRVNDKKPANIFIERA